MAPSRSTDPPDRRRATSAPLPSGASRRIAGSAASSAACRARAFGRRQQQLRALVAGAARHRRGQRAVHLECGAGGVQRDVFAACRNACAASACWASARSNARCANGGKPAASRCGEFGVGEGAVAAAEQGLQQRMLRMVGLQQHLAGRVGAAGAAGDLDQQLREFLARRGSRRENKPSSMPTTATRVRFGRSWPFASICVPTRMPGASPKFARAAIPARRGAGWCRDRCAAPARRGTARRSASSMRSVPTPCGCNARPPQSGHAFGAGLARAAVMALQAAAAGMHGHRCCRACCSACIARSSRSRGTAAPARSRGGS